MDVPLTRLALLACNEFVSVENPCPNVTEKSQNGRKFKNCDESIAATVQEWTKIVDILSPVQSR